MNQQSIMMACVSSPATKFGPRRRDSSNMMQHQQQTFASMIKSPMSQCVDNMLVAASVVNGRDLELRAAAAGEENLMPQQQQQSYFPLPPRATKATAKKSKSKHKKNKRNSMEILTVNADTAADLEAMMAHPVKNRRLILTMALDCPPRKKDNELDPNCVPSLIIQEGFFWKDYPLLENVLHEEMRDYYSHSSSSRQSKHQQVFNNNLVNLIRQTADQYGYEFDFQYFNDKRLRDRVRCFYKTHLQNAKKRLGTLHKHSLYNTPEQRASLKEIMRNANDLEDSDCEEDDFLHKRRRLS